MMNLKERLNNLPFKKDVEDAGGEIYAVGGIVRDSMLDIESKDLDLLIRLVSKEDLLEILKKYGAVDEVGQSFGVIKFTPPGEETIDIALPRTERKTGEKHTDFEVNVDHMLPLEDDLARRDFTINAMAIDCEGKLYDPFNGKEAIEKKVINIVSRDSFSEDPLRMLRAIQFASRLDFTIEVLTAAEMRLRANRIKTVSGERILIELQKIVDKGDPFKAVTMLNNYGLYTVLFPGHHPTSYNYKVANIKTMAEFIVYLLGTYSTTHSFYKKELRGDVKTQKHIKALCRIYSSIYKHKDTRITLFEIFDDNPELIDTTVFEGSYIDDVLKLFKNGTLPKRLSELKINGNDILALGLKGTEVGEAFRRVVKAIMEERVDNDRKQLLRFLKVEFKIH